MAALKERFTRAGEMGDDFKLEVGPSWFVKKIALDDVYSISLSEHPERGDKSGFAFMMGIEGKKIFSFEAFDLEDGMAHQTKGSGQILCQCARTPNGEEVAFTRFESDTSFGLFLFDPINPPNFRKIPNPDWLVTIRAGTEISWPYLD